jgi:hypothetical protein
MKEELDVSEVLDAVERLQRGYRKPLPGTENRLADDDLDSHIPPKKSDSQANLLTASGAADDET